MIINCRKHKKELKKNRDNQIAKSFAFVKKIEHGSYVLFIYMAKVLNSEKW